MPVEGIRANNGLLETINIALLLFCGLASGLHKKSRLEDNTWPALALRTLQGGTPKS